MLRFQQNKKNVFALALLLLCVTVVSVDADQKFKNILQRLDAFRRRVIVDVQSALANNHKTLHRHSKMAIDSGEDSCEMKMAKSESQAREEVQMLKALLDGAYSDLEMAQLTLQNQEQNVNAKIALKVQEESDLWRAKYSRLLKEQSIKAASLEHAKKENIEIKHKLEQVENEKRSAESMYLAVKQDFDSLREQLKAGDAVMNKALENAWIGRQDAESELVALKSKQQALMEELNSFRGNASMTDSAKNKALENAWTVLQETMDELAVIHRLVEQLRQEKETQKVELHRNFENEVNKWRRDYSKLLQSQSAIMTELHHVQSDNHALREELDNLLGQSKVADAVKSKALENAWVGRQDAQKELAFANQLIDAMRKQVEKLQDLADQREKEAAQVAEAASSLAKLQRDFEAETSSKQAALVERNKELENKVRELQTLLEEKTVEYQESVNSQLLEAEDKWWKQLSSARSQRSKNILSTKNTEIEKLNKDVEIMSSEVAMLRVENERLVARLDERHGEIVALSSGTESFVRLHEDFKISAEKQIHYLNQRVSDTEALLDRKEKEIGDLQDLLKTKSNEWNALLREETAKLNKDCMKMLLDRENQCQSQVAAATYATMATIDAVQQDLRHAHEQLYRITEQNKRTEAKVISQNSQLKNCSTSLEEIMREKNALNEQHGIHLQQAMSEVDELQTILLEKNDELALLQTTLGEIVDETELLVEKAAFETAAKWQQDLLQAQQDCQTRCSRAAALEETQEQLRDAIETLETSNLISRELKESLDHCRLESGQLSDTSSRLTILHEKCQRQITESEMKFKLDIDDIETSARKRIESITVELVGCQDKLNESGSVCAKSLSTGQQECRKEIESVKKLSEQEISVVKKTGQANLDKHLDMAAEALEKAKRQASECRRDLDRLSVAAQGLSKFQIIVDERATEVQNSVSAQLEVVKAELDRKDKLVKELTHQLQIDSVDTEDRIRDLEESCSQKLSWLENSNHMKIQSLEESRDSALRELKLCSEESSDVKSEVARLRSVITEMSEENELLDLKNQQKEKKVQEMNTQLLQKEELFNSIVTQNDELEKNCQSAIRAIEEQKGMEIKNEQKRCSRAFSKPPSSLITIPNESGNCGIKVETESSMTQKLWTLFGHNSEAYDEQRLEAAIEQRTIEWKRKFQDLENKSTALLRETEEALKICYNYGEEKAKNLTVELGDFCQTRLNEQETRYNQLVGNIQSDLDNAAQEKQRLAVQLVEAEAAVATKTEEIKHCSKSVEELLADKEHMSGIIVDLRTHHEDFLMKASKLEAQLLETQKEMKQKKMDAEYWRQVYEHRTYFNLSHVQEDAQFAIQEVQEYYESLLLSAKEFVEPIIPLALELSKHAQAATHRLFRYIVQVYDKHGKTHVKPVIDAGLNSYKNNVTPLYQELGIERKKLFAKARLAVESFFDKVAIQFSRSCPPITSQMEHLEELTNLRLFRAGKNKLESLCLDAKGTSIFIFKILGVVLLFTLRRPILYISLWFIRVLTWAIRSLVSMVLAPFLFVFRFPVILLRLVRPMRKVEEKAEKQSCELAAEDTMS